jgi:hypothetical protein
MKLRPTTSTSVPLPDDNDNAGIVAGKSSAPSAVKSAPLVEISTTRLPAASFGETQHILVE